MAVGQEGTIAREGGCLQNEFGDNGAMSPSAKDEKELLDQIQSKTSDKPSTVVLSIKPTRKQSRSFGAQPTEKDAMIDFAVAKMRQRGYRVMNVDRGIALNPSTATFELEDRTEDFAAPTAGRVVKCPHCGQLIQM